MSDESRLPLDQDVQDNDRAEAQIRSGVRTPTFRGRRKWLAPTLLLLTFASTIFSGSNQFAVPRTRVDAQTGQTIVEVQLDPETGRPAAQIDWTQTLLQGLMYSAAVMAILGAHELGHYLQARRHRVPASLPLFLPMPLSPLGTMGAVILQQAGVADRKAMFDIAISGPLAGLAVAIPVNWWGILHSHVIQVPPHSVGWTNPLVVDWMITWIKGPLAPGQDIVLDPFLMAGWVGIFITGLNLIPIGQLGGGHLLYCLVGKRAHRVAWTLYVGAVLGVIVQAVRGHGEYLGWTLMLALIAVMGTRHPPTADDRVPLGWGRVILGWLTLAFLTVSFVPSPMYETKGAPVQPPGNAISDRL